MIDMMEALRQAVKDSGEPINHSEAWSLACHRLEESNLARCYLELRELARRASDGPMNVEDTYRLRAVVEAND